MFLFFSYVFASWIRIFLFLTFLLLGALSWNWTRRLLANYSKISVATGPSTSMLSFSCRYPISVVFHSVDFRSVRMHCKYIYMYIIIFELLQNHAKWVPSWVAIFYWRPVFKSELLANLLHVIIKCLFWMATCHLRLIFSGRKSWFPHGLENLENENFFQSGKSQGISPKILGNEGIIVVFFSLSQTLIEVYLLNRFLYFF